MSELLPWQQAQWGRVEAWRRQGRVPHALLLHGASGAGAEGFAERLAASLLCESPDRRLGPCGECRGCRLFAGGAHPDLERLAPAEEGKAIEVAQARELVHFVSLRPQRGAFKVALVQGAERLNRNAANALLKSLEEPPPGTVLLLVTPAPSRVLATIRSRCQRLAFPEPSPAEALPWLRQQLPPDAERPELLLALAGGLPLRALDLSGPEPRAARDRVLQDLEDLARGEADPVVVAQNWRSLSPPVVLDWILTLTVDLIRLHRVDNPPRLVHPDTTPRLRGLSRVRGARLLFELYDRCLRARTLLESHPGLNHQLLLEDLAIRWLART
jgi:DNA polymerase-3 subunit delta'